ncbi:unnamed protein product, partial [Symbiodinium sp. KB8]
MGPYHPFRSYGACFYNQLGSKVWEIRTPTHTLYTKPDNSKDYRQYSVSVGGLPGHFNCTDKSECLRRLSQHLYCKLKTACCRSRNASQELGFDPVHCLQQGRGDTCLGIVQKSRLLPFVFPKLAFYAYTRPSPVHRQLCVLVGGHRRPISLHLAALRGNFLVGLCLALAATARFLIKGAPVLTIPGLFPSPFSFGFRLPSGTAASCALITGAPRLPILGLFAFSFTFGLRLVFLAAAILDAGLILISERSRTGPGPAHALHAPILCHAGT